MLNNIQFTGKINIFVAGQVGLIKGDSSDKAVGYRATAILCVFILLCTVFLCICSGDETGDTSSGRSPATKDMAPPPPRRPVPPHNLSPPKVGPFTSLLSFIYSSTLLLLI